MKKIILFFILFSSFCSFSQIEDAWVYFKSKPNAATFLANPLTMLTQRSLDRRTLQNIPLDIKDVPIHQPYIDMITMAFGITIKAKSKWMNCLHIQGSQIDINALLTFTFVDHLEYADRTLNNKNANYSQQNIPVNKNLSTTTSYNYGNSSNQISMLNGNLLHQQNYTGTGIQIAVFDAGFPSVNTAQPFARLFTNNAILGGYNFVDKSSNFYTGNSHGTLVLSCMGGYKDNQLVGTAPDAKYYLYITEYAPTEEITEESNWVEAAEEADRVGVDIITSSLGYFEYDNPAHNHTYADMTGNKTFISRGANLAFSRGIIVVASAGNSGGSSNPFVAVPAEATNVLAIGAVKADRNYASFSSIGPSFDGRIKPDVMAQGQASVLSNTNGTITTANGTSFSGPILAGMVACLWQALPNLTNQQIINLVKKSSDRYTNPNAQYGYGIPDFQKAINLNISENPILKPNLLENFVFYQSPNTDNVSFAFPKGILKATVNFYDVLGQFVFTKNITPNDNFVPISSWSVGVYVYNIDTGSIVQNGKFLRK
jgi:serine protease AprX